MCCAWWPAPSRGLGLIVLLHSSTAEALAAVVVACKDGAKIVDVCNVGDDLINKCAGAGGLLDPGRRNTDLCNPSPPFSPPRHAVRHARAQGVFYYL